MVHRTWPCLPVLLAAWGAAHATEVRLDAEAAALPACALPLQRCAEAALRAHCMPGHEQVDLRALPVAAATALLRGGESASVRPLRWQGPPARRMTVWLDVLSQARHVRAIPVEFEVRAYVTGWQAVSDLRPAMTALDEAGLKRVRVDVTDLAAAPWRATLDGYRLRKPLLAGQTLTAAHLEPVTAVTRGQWVDVNAAAGALHVEAQAQALQDGQVGDLIRIRVSRSAAAVTGRVTATGRVEVVW